MSWRVAGSRECGEQARGSVRNEDGRRQMTEDGLIGNRREINNW